MHRTRHYTKFPHHKTPALTSQCCLLQRNVRALTTLNTAQNVEIFQPRLAFDDIARFAGAWKRSRRLVAGGRFANASCYLPAPANWEHGSVKGSRIRRERSCIIDTARRTGLCAHTGGDGDGVIRFIDGRTALAANEKRTFWHARGTWERRSKAFGNTGRPLRARQPAAEPTYPCHCSATPAADC